MKSDQKVTGIFPTGAVAGRIETIRTRLVGATQRGGFNYGVEVKTDIIAALVEPELLHAELVEAEHQTTPSRIDAPFLFALLLGIARSRRRSLGVTSRTSNSRPPLLTLMPLAIAPRANGSALTSSANNPK